MCKNIHVASSTSTDPECAGCRWLEQNNIRYNNSINSSDNNDNHNSSNNNNSSTPDTDTNLKYTVAFSSTDVSQAQGFRGGG